MREPSATKKPWPRALAGDAGRRRCFSLLALVAATLEPSSLRALTTEVDASLDAQFYTFQSPYGEPLIRRRRYTETLGLALYDLAGASDPRRPSLFFRSRLRLDADFGQDPGERDPNSPRFVPGVEQAPVDLMYAYLEGTRYAGGLLGFRLGRQYAADVLGFWSFDGALVSLTTPAFFRLEAYGGLEQRAGLPLLTTPRYQADGVARGSREDLRQNQWTSYLEASRVAPALGVALETSDVSWLHARVSYRRVENRDTVVVSPFVDENGELEFYADDRVSSERAGASLRVESFELGALSASTVYDLYLAEWSEWAVGVDWYATPAVTLGAELDRYLPSFDGDSIFNWFSRGAQTRAVARADVRFSRRLDAAVSGGVTRYEMAGDPALYAASGDDGSTGELDFVGTLAGRYRWHDGDVSLRALSESGARGHRAGADLTTRKTFDAGYYDALVVLSLYDWEDGLRPDRAATSFAYVVGGGVMPGIELFSGGRFGVEWEHAMNRLVGQRYRVLATLDFSVLR